MMHRTWCHRNAWPTSVNSHMSNAANNLQTHILKTSPAVTARKFESGNQWLQTKKL